MVVPSALMRLGVVGLVAVLVLGNACRTKEDTVAVAEPEPGVVRPLIPGTAPGALFREREPDVGPPRSFKIAPGIDLSPEKFLQLHSATLWELTPEDEFRLERIVDGFNGHSTNYQYVQFHGGYRVLEARLVLTTRGERLHYGSGKVIGNLHVDLNVAIPEARAKQIAIERVAKGFGVGVERLQADYGNFGGLVIEYSRRLVWRFIVSGRGDRIVDVDAANGAILSDYDACDDCETRDYFPQ